MTPLAHTRAWVAILLGLTTVCVIADRPQLLGSECVYRDVQLKSYNDSLVFQSVQMRAWYDQPLYLNGKHSFERIYNFGRTEDVDPSIKGSLKLCCEEACHEAGAPQTSANRFVQFISGAHEAKVNKQSKNIISSLSGFPHVIPKPNELNALLIEAKSVTKGPPSKCVLYIKKVKSIRQQITNKRGQPIMPIEVAVPCRASREDILEIFDERGVIMSKAMQERKELQDDDTSSFLQTSDEESDIVPGYIDEHYAEWFAAPHSLKWHKLPADLNNVDDVFLQTDDTACPSWKLDDKDPKTHLTWRQLGKQAPKGCDTSGAAGGDGSGGSGGGVAADPNAKLPTVGAACKTWTLDDVDPATHLTWRQLGKAAPKKDASCDLDLTGNSGIAVEGPAVSGLDPVTRLPWKLLGKAPPQKSAAAIVGAQSASNVKQPKIPAVSPRQRPFWGRTKDNNGPGINGGQGALSLRDPRLPAALATALNNGAGMFGARVTGVSLDNAKGKMTPKEEARKLPTLSASPQEKLESLFYPKGANGFGEDASDRDDAPDASGLNDGPYKVTGNEHYPDWYDTSCGESCGWPTGVPGSDSMKPSGDANTPTPGKVTVEDPFASWCDLHDPLQNPFCPFPLPWFILVNLIIKLIVPTLAAPVIDTLAEEFVAGYEAPLQLVKNILLQTEEEVIHPDVLKSLPADVRRAFEEHAREKHHSNQTTAAPLDPSGRKPSAFPKLFKPRPPKDESSAASGKPAFPFVPPDLNVLHNIERRPKEDIPSPEEFDNFQFENHYFAQLDEKLTHRFLHDFGVNVKSPDDDMQRKTLEDVTSRKDFNPKQLLPDDHVPLRIVFDEEVARVLHGKDYRKFRHKHLHKDAPRFSETANGPFNERPPTPDNTVKEARIKAPPKLPGIAIIPLIKMALYYALVHPMTNSLSSILTMSITNAVTPPLFDKLTKDLKDYLRMALSHTMIHTLTGTLPLTLGVTVPEVLEQVLPVHLIFEMTSSLTNTMTRSITHSVSSTLVQTMGKSNRAEFYCYYCREYREYCEQCKALDKKEDVFISGHYANWLASYYTDYYAPFYSKEVFVLMKTHPE